MQIPVFHGTATPDGQLVLEPTEAAQQVTYLRSIAGQVDVIIRKRRTTRSLDQNAWLWGVAIPILADALGYDKHEHEQLHYALLAECFGTTFDQRFGREIPRVSSSRLNTKEFSDYME